MGKKYLHRPRCDNAVVDLYEYLLSNNYKWTNDLEWIALGKKYNRYIKYEDCTLIPDYLFRPSVKSLCFSWTTANKDTYVMLYNLCYIDGKYVREKLFQFFRDKRKCEEQFYLDGNVDSKKFYHWMNLYKRMI